MKRNVTSSFCEIYERYGYLESARIIAHGIFVTAPHVVRFMKRFLIALVTIACATAAFAGISYQFTTTSSGMSEHGMSGVVKSDAGRRRIEITASDDTIFPAGSVMLANASGMTVFDPAKKTYYDLDLDKYLQQTAGLGAQSPFVQLEFGNPHVSVKDDGAAETIGGYPTRRQTVTSSFDVTPNVPGMGQQMKITVRSTSQIWVTDKLPADAANVLETAKLHTGVPAIDKVVESMHFNGFPMKQVTTTSVSMNGGDAMNGTSTTVVSNVNTNAKVAAGDFLLPAGYTKVDDPLKSMLKKYGMD